MRDKKVRDGELWAAQLNDVLRAYKGWQHTKRQEFDVDQALLMRMWPSSQQEAEIVGAMEQLQRQIDATSEPVPYELLGDAPTFVVPDG